MRRTTNEIIRNMQRRVAKLESQNGVRGTRHNLRSSASKFTYSGDFGYELSSKFFTDANPYSRSLIKKPLLTDLVEGAENGLGLFDVNNGEIFLIVQMDSVDLNQNRPLVVDSSEDEDEAFTLFSYHARSYGRNPRKSVNQITQ